MAFHFGLVKNRLFVNKVILVELIIDSNGLAENP